MALELLLTVACLVIYILSRRYKITHANVTDSHEVLVLAAATPTTYPDDPRLGSEAKEDQSEERRLMHIDWAALGIGPLFP